MNIDPIDVQTHLRGLTYPADRNDLVAAAQNNGAPEDIVNALQGMPEATYDGPDEVVKGLS